jgi:2-haloacid dehalogenase
MRLATLSNSPDEMSAAQLDHAGLRDLFEHVLSADSIQRLKPAPEAYRMAADRLGVATGDLLLIAAHGWDITGAHHAGCATAFVKRPGMVLGSLAPAPTYAVPNLRALAEALLASAERGT